MIVPRDVPQQPALFHLPEQRAPDVLYTDRHALYPCSRCGATGIEANRIPSWVSCRDVLWDPKCRGCDGAGRVLKYVGICTDV